MNAPLMPPNLISNIPELPADVILIVLEELHKIQSISHLRVVSKQFEALVRPLSYRHVHLTDRIVAPFAFKDEPYDPLIVQLQVARDVKIHTRHLTVKRSLDWCLVAKLIQSLNNLCSFTWAFWGPEATNFHKSANSTIGPALCKSWPNVQLHFEGICASTYDAWKYKDFPNSNLISCKIAAWEKPELPMIRNLLFERPKLQELHLVHGNPHSYDWRRPIIEIHEDQTFKRLPALKTLIIDGYYWNHSPWEISNLWDWSNITHLELRNVHVDNFLLLVPHQDLSGLRVFIEWWCSQDYFRSQQKEKTASLCSLMMHTIAIEELRIRCDTQKPEVVSLIARNGSNLRTLSLRCFGLRFISRWMPLTIDQLRTIGPSCPQLVEIEVDLALPTFPHTLSASSQSESRSARTRTPTMVTRSMSATQTVKLDTKPTARCHIINGGLKDTATNRVIPYWYWNAYNKEKYQEHSWVSPHRAHGLEMMASEEGKDPTQAEEEYLAWKRTHRKEEVAAALKSLIDTDPAPALAEFRNLRRLTIFTRIYFFVPPETSSATSRRRREAVQNWLNGLLSAKVGAGFEEVIVHVENEVMNDGITVKMRNYYSIYTYAGQRNADGAAEILEETDVHFSRRG